MITLKNERKIIFAIVLSLTHLNGFSQALERLNIVEHDEITVWSGTRSLNSIVIDNIPILNFSMERNEEKVVLGTLGVMYKVIPEKFNFTQARILDSEDNLLGVLKVTEFYSIFSYHKEYFIYEQQSGNKFVLKKMVEPYESYAVTTLKEENSLYRFKLKSPHKTIKVETNMELIPPEILPLLVMSRSIQIRMKTKRYFLHLLIASIL